VPENRCPAAPAGGAGARRQWDDYWSTEPRGLTSALYARIASFYRCFLIRPFLDEAIRRWFPCGSVVLHAGCGGGEVDSGVVGHANIIGLDLSAKAVERHRRLLGDRCKYVVGSVLELPFASSRFDGLYSLGVMEHFEEADVVRVLVELARVVRPGGKLVLFWAPSWGLSVIALGIVHFVLNRLLRRRLRLHPEEPSKIRSAAQARNWLEQAGLELIDYRFGPADGFTYAVVIAGKGPAG
jgi:ubiquinone/menaquinone biosynthesis C-methylase UbiE